MNSLESIVQKFKHLTGLHSDSSLIASARPAYDFVLNSLYQKQGLVRVLNDDERIYVRPAHRYQHEDYEPLVYQYLKQAIQPGDVVLDIGAHIGLTAILFARWAGDEGQVYAFEPTPSTRAALTDHLTLNEVAERVEVVGAAISDHVGNATFHVSSNSPENTLNAVHSRLGIAQQVQVPVTTIDAFCAARKIKPNFIKIDIEGFEWHALRGATSVLSACRPRLLVEVHPMNWDEIGESADSATKLLSRLGCRITPLEGQKSALTEYGHIALELSK